MNRSMPFADLLAQLRAAGIAIGVDDHLAVERLVERYDGADRDELRDAIAALLGRSDSEIAQIRREFDAVFPVAAPPARPPPARRRWGAALALTAILAGILVAFWRIVPAVPGPGSDTGPIADAGGAGSQPPACVPPKPQAAVLHEPLPAWVGVGLLGITAVVFAGFATRRRRRWTRTARKRRLEQLPGPRGYQIAAGAQLSRALLDDIAILLTARSETRELDVERTVERTARAGLAPVLAYRTRRQRQPVAVVIDREPEMRPFRAAAVELARGLQERGVVVEQPRGLVEPERRDAAAIVVSTGAARNDHDARVPAWILERAERRRLVWIHPVEDPQQWPQALRGARVPMFPFNRGGLLAAARYLAGEDPAPLRTPPLRWDDVERLRAMLTIAVAPSPEVAERLRRQFLPHAPQSIHAAVRDEPFPDAGHAAAWLTRTEPGLDMRVRRFLLELLTSAEPVAGSAGHLRWRRDRAVVMSGLPDRADDARRELAELATGPIGEAVPTGPRRLAKMWADRSSLRWLPGLLWCVVPVAAAIAALVAPVVTYAPTFDDTRFALRVETDASQHQRLRVELRSGGPVTELAEFYDDGVLDDSVGRGDHIVPPGTHCYQVWRRVSAGRFDGSNPVYVVQPDENGDKPGTLVVTFSSRLDGAIDDQRYTVAKGTDTRSGLSGVPLELPAGIWIATASRARHAEWTQEVDIVSGQRVELAPTLVAAYTLVTLRTPAGMKPASLLVDKVPWDGQALQRTPGPLWIKSLSPYYIFDQTVLVERRKEQTIDVSARQVGLATFDVQPEAARKSLEIDVPPGFELINGAVRGVGRLAVTLHATGYEDAQLELEVVPGQTITRPFTFTPSSDTPLPEACATINVDDLLSLAAAQYSAGYPRAALLLVTKALGCKENVRMYRLAAMYACGSRDLASARIYFAKLPAQYRGSIQLKCQQEGLALRPDAANEEKKK
jgi:hypothetical protein